MVSSPLDEQAQDAEDRRAKPSLYGTDSSCRVAFQDANLSRLTVTARGALPAHAKLSQGPLG